MTPGQRVAFSIAVSRDQAEAGRHEAQAIELRLESPLAQPDGTALTLATRTYEVADLVPGESWNPMTVTGVAAGSTLRVLVAVYPAEQGPYGAALKFDDARLTID